MIRDWSSHRNNSTLHIFDGYGGVDAWNIYPLHLMLLCPFAQACWAWFNCHVILQEDLHRNIESFKLQLHVPFFMEIIILMGWSIWNARNGLIFNQVQPSVEATKRAFKSEFALILLRAKRSYFPSIELWLNNLA
jgi:hypothetical protein